jgi:hypothetical protein
MRIAKPLFGSVATIEYRITLHDEAVGRVRATGHRNIRGVS